MKSFFKSMALLLVLAVCSSQTIKAQSAFEQGKSYVSLGYGYQLVSIKSIFKAYEAYTGFKASGIGPVLLKYEYAVSEHIGIGLSMGFTAASVAFTHQSTNNNGDLITFNDKYKYSKITVTPRLNFHLGENEKIDPYIGIGLGFKKATYTLQTNDPNFGGGSFNGLPMSFEASFGCRFLFTENIGAFVELGAGHGFAQIGAVAKF